MMLCCQCDLIFLSSQACNSTNGQLTILFRMTFGPGPLDNFQKSLAWQRHQLALPVRDKLARHYTFCLPTCPRCEQNNETLLHASKNIGIVCLRRIITVLSKWSTTVLRVNSKDCSTFLL